MKTLAFLAFCLAVFGQSPTSYGSETNAACSAVATREASATSTTVSQNLAAAMAAGLENHTAVNVSSFTQSYWAARKAAYDRCVATAASPAPLTTATPNPAAAQVAATPAPVPTQTQPASPSPGGQLIQYCPGITTIPPGSQLVLSTTGCITYTKIQPPPR